jgi:hypothetical protein
MRQRPPQHNCVSYTHDAHIAHAQC